MGQYKLIFGDKKSIEYRDKIEKRIKKRNIALKKSGLTNEQFNIKEELKYWGVY